MRAWADARWAKHALWLGAMLGLAAVVVVRRLVPMSLASAKGLVALGDAVDARDALAAQRAIEAWGPPLSGDDVSIPARLAKGLLHAFSLRPEPSLLVQGSYAVVPSSRPSSRCSAHFGSATVARSSRSRAR